MAYRPGRRPTDPVYGNRTYSEGRYGWVSTILGQFVILLQKGEDENLDVTLMHPQRKLPAVTWILTACTEQELILIKDIFNTAIDLALDTARRRDKVAQDAFERGDDSYSRSYRQVPQLVYRQRTLDAYRESISKRSEPVSSVPERESSDLGDVRGSGDDLVEQYQEGSQPKDNEPQTN